MLLYKMSLQQYNNALSQYQNGADGMKNYIKGKSDMLKDKAVGARDQAMAKAQAALSNALQIDQGKKEQLENTIGTAAIAGPVIFKGVKQLGGKIAQYKAGTTPVETEGAGVGAEGDILAGGGGATEGTGGSLLSYAEAGEETPGTVARLPSGGAGGAAEEAGTVARLPTVSSGRPQYGDYDDLTGGEEEDDELEPTFSTQYGESSGLESSGVESSAAEINPFTSPAGGFKDQGYSGGGSTISTQAEATTAEQSAGGNAATAGGEAATAAEQSAVSTAESTGATAAENLAGIGGEIAGAGSEAASAAAAAIAAGGEAAGASLAAGAAAVGAVAMPLIAAGALGYELYNLFDHHSGPKKTTPDAPAPMSFTGTGIKDTFTSGGFAAASTDGVTTSVSSNSAF